MIAASRWLTATEFRARFPGVAARLDDAAIGALLEACFVVRTPSGELLVDQGWPAPALYFLWQGRFGLRLGAEGRIEELGLLPPHAIVGEVSFFDGEPASAGILAISRQATALVLPLASFEELAGREPRVAAGLYRAVTETLAERLRAATEQFEGLQTPGPAQPASPVAALLRTLFGLGAGR